MTGTSSDSSSGSSSSSGGDDCGGVSSGIASALKDGSLDFGGEGSEMSYECSEIIEDDS